MSINIEIDGIKDIDYRSCYRVPGGPVIGRFILSADNSIIDLDIKLEDLETMITHIKKDEDYEPDSTD